MFIAQVIVSLSKFLEKDKKNTVVRKVGEKLLSSIYFIRVEVLKHLMKKTTAISL